MIALAMGGMTAAAQTQTTIDIDIEGLDDGRVTVGFMTVPELSSQGNPLNIDTNAHDGRLVYQPAIEGPNIVSIYLKDLDIIIPFDGGGYATLENTSAKIEFPLLPGDNIKVRGRVVDKRVEAEISGSEGAAVASRLRREMLPDRMFFDSLHVATAQGDGYDLEEQNEMIRKFNEYLKGRYGGDTAPSLKWLSENPDSPAADFVIVHFGLVGPMLESDPALVEKLRGGAFGPMIDAHIRRADNAKLTPAELAVGSAAPNFTLQTPDGGTFSLGDVKKDYVVIDFWASWCGPCVSGFPKMKEYYERYGDRLEIVGVATNDSRSAWLGALGKHTLPWVSVLDTDNAVGKIYSVTALPTKIILGPDRNIVAIFDYEGEAFYAELDKLLK